MNREKLNAGNTNTYYSNVTICGYHTQWIFHKSQQQQKTQRIERIKKRKSGDRHEWKEKVSKKE